MKYSLFALLYQRPAHAQFDDLAWPAFASAMRCLAASDNLCSKPREQHLGAFRAVNHVVLALGLRSDDA